MTKAPEINAFEALEIIKEHGATPELLEIIATNPFTADYYSKYITQEPFPIGEEAISQDVHLAYWYAVRYGVILPLAEKLFAKNTEYAFQYFYHIKMQPEPLCEEALCRNCDYAYKYMLRFGFFDKGIEAISKDATLALSYAMNVLNAPFPMGEEAIYSSKRERLLYRHYVLNEPNLDMKQIDYYYDELFGLPF